MGQKEQAHAPHIIYIFADDLGYGDVSALNEDAQFETPHLDRLAAEGISYSDAHATSSVCTPSRYSLLTGRYNWRTRLKKSVFEGYTPHLIAEDRLTVASLLKNYDYQTACVGKWHLGMDWVKTGPKASDVDFAQPIAHGPIARGFDYFYGISASLDMPPYVYIENDRVTAEPDHVTGNQTAMGWWREGPTAPDFKHEEVLPKLTEKVIDLIEGHESEDPFFIYFPLSSPHTPVLPTPAFQGKSKTNAYGDFVLMTDDVVGQILATLDEQGIAGNTLIIFASDNGCAPHMSEAMAEFGHASSYIFRGHKADIYEGGHRVPLLARWPEMIKAGTVTDETVSLADFTATAAELVGHTLQADEAVDSRSHLALWRGEQEEALHEAVVHHSIEGAFAIRQGKWKLELCPGSGGWSDPKPGEEADDAPAFQLYDLAADIGETTNLVDARPEIVAELTALLVKYIKDGRSTDGPPQPYTKTDDWPGLEWLADYLAT